MILLQRILQMHGYNRLLELEIMKNRNTLQRLEEFYNQPEVVNGFASQQACVSWANKVAPLLRFNDNYYQTFIHYSQILNANVSSYTAEPAFRTMVSQVEMAIEELKADIDLEENAPKIKSTLTVSDSADLVDFKPSFYGVSLNLNEAWRRAKRWFGRRK